MTETEYKQSKIGENPVDWNVQKVSDIFKIETGTTPSTKREDYWKDGDVEWITPADMSKINSKPLLPKSNRKVTEKAVKETNLTLMPKDSIIISTRAPVGYVALVDKEATFNQGCKGLIPKKEVDTAFYCYYLLHQSRKLDLMSGQTTFKELTKTLLENFDVVEPPLPEQHGIANILSTVDDNLQKVDEIIAKTERLKKGLMHDLLTKGIGHEEFKDTKVGEIPSDWGVQKVSGIFTVETGTTPPTKKEEYWKNGDIEWITPADMSKINSKPLLPESNRKVTKNAVDDTNLTLMPKDSIIISTRAPVGYVALVDKEATFNQGCKGLMPKKEVDTTFYCYYLLHQSRKLDLMSGQTTFKELTKTLLENFDLVEPSLPEQQGIAEKLFTVDRKLELEKQRKQKLQRIKKGLMNDLLTGKKRVKVSEKVS